jgi:dethiobiotin synthetase
MSQHPLPPQIFVTGTDTDIGKTVVCAILMAGTRGKYWKPVQCGSEEMTDTQWIRQVTGLPDTHFLPERFRLRRPLAPHAAAAADGLSIGLDDFRLPDVSPLIVEGAGGVMVPLNDRDFMLDLIVRLALPVVLVASSRVGTINHCLLTLDKLRSRNAVIAGVAMNGIADEGNRRAIEHFGQTRVIAQIEPLVCIHRAALEEAFQKYFNHEVHRKGLK